MQTDPLPTDPGVPVEPLEASDESFEPKTGAGLAIAALVLPALTGTVLFFVRSNLVAILISGATVITTAVMLSIDAYRLRRKNGSRRQPDSPGVLLLGMLLAWIVVYPLVFFRRSRFGGPKLGIPAVIVAVVFALGPLVYSMIRPVDLPLCTSRLVVDLVEQSLQGSPLGAHIESIDGHEEIRYDRAAETRHGTCLVHTKDGDIEVKFKVEWQNRDAGQFIVTCDPLPIMLPLCDSKEVVDLLAKVLAGTEMGDSVQAIESHQQLRYDETEDVRYCECTVLTAEGSKEFRYIVEWINRDDAYFGVRIPPVDLPSCTNSEVIKVLERAIRDAPAGPFVRSIDGHREVSYDPDKDVRQGECVVHLPDGETRVTYFVAIRDRERGSFRVWTADGN